MINNTYIAPNATIGMLGGGQLGRLFTLAAKTLGYRVVVLEPDPVSPAAQVADSHIVAAYDDTSALRELGQQCTVITTEFENIPAQTLTFLSQYCPVHPSASAVQITQDRQAEKAFIRDCGLLPVPYLAINTLSDFDQVEAHLHYPAILKTARLGYDGKGQVVVNSTAEAKQAFEQLQAVPCVLEQRVTLACEISVILARNTQGEVQCFPVAENQHRHGILHQTIVPARIASDLALSAQAAATRLANKLDFIGVMAVEFFVTQKGELLVNEIAPRTHNSGHYTIDACLTSQFEQQVRMVCGLPFGATQLLLPVVMVNLLGDLWPTHQQPNWQHVLEQANSKLHLYGKVTARVGRKMGHFCTVDANQEQAIQTAQHIFQQLMQDKITHG